MGDGDHRALAGHDQRSRRDELALDVGEQPSSVRGDVNAARAEFVGGVLESDGAEYRSVLRACDGAEDSGLAGAGRAGDHFRGAGRGEHAPIGRGLVQPQPARRRLPTRVREAAQLRLKQGGIGAEAPRGQVARQARRALRMRMRDEFVPRGRIQ